MHEITVTVTAEGPSGSSSLNICTALGASLGRSEDGTTTAAILGNPHCPEAAARYAQAYAASGGNPASCSPPDVGLVFLDHAAKSVTVVAAPIGLRQIFWSASSNTLTVSSSFRGLQKSGPEAAGIAPEALLHYVYFHMLPGPASFYPGVAKLDGGHVLRWTGRETTVTRYWSPTFIDVPACKEAEAAEELRRLLRDAVARSVSQGRNVGAFLSGGLDSSTVAGLATELRPGLPTVTIGFDAPGYDETQYARTASKHFRTRPLEYYVTPDDVLATLPEIAAMFPEPFGNSSAAATYHCARIAREHGLDTLLAGDGGDEIFGGNERYAKQMVFERYSRLPATVRRRLLEPLVRNAARLTSAFPIGKARSYIDQASVALPDRLQSYNFLHRHDPTEVFAAELLAQVDREAPLHLLREEFAVPMTSSAVNRMLFLDWKFTLHDNDLVKVNTMCRMAGVQVRYPMLDQALVDFSLRIPGDWKVRNGVLRWFFKRAMADFLPRQIIEKKKHGFGLPFGVWTRTHVGLRALATDCLASLAKRRYFRPEFLRDALRLHQEGHASYYGELVWILMVLELWLQRHMPSARL